MKFMDKSNLRIASAGHFLRHLVARMLFCGLLALLGILDSSCVNTIDNMLEDYNNSFDKPEYHEEMAEPLPGDENFQETSMLLEKYPVANDASLTIVAPKAQTYHWEVYRIVKTLDTFGGYTAVDIEKIPVNFPVSVYLDGQSLSFYIPDVNEFIDGTYELRLEVTAKGKRYKDAAMLIVYDPFYDFY